jgi:urease subunit alpha
MLSRIRRMDCAEHAAIRAGMEDARAGAKHRLTYRDLRRRGVEKQFVAVAHTRDISKKSMMHNNATPKITVDPETYEVTADGELLTCAPAEVLPMAQRYFLF